MIRSITADKSSFKSIKFKNGLNVVLADRTKESTKKDSTNGLGKSTILEIIHFCLGSNKGETLNKKKLDDWTFTLELELAGKTYSVSRNTNEQNHIVIVGDCSKWPLEIERDEAGKQFLNNANWKNILRFLMFNGEFEYEQKYVPTSRSLLSYRIRRGGKPGGYLEPFTQYRQQSVWDAQVNTCYLLELGWEFMSQLQILRDKEKVIDQLKKATTFGLISDIIGNTGELEAKKIQLEAQVKNETIELSNFKIHKQYRELEKNSNQYTKKIHGRVNQNIIDKQLLDHYESSLEKEIDAQPDQVKKIYEEAGLIFPDQVSKKLNDVFDFHEKLVFNRKNFLQTEIKRLDQQILDQESEIQSLSNHRAEIMNILRGRGALDEYSDLQAHHQKIIADLNETIKKLDSMKKFQKGKSALKIEFELQQQKAEADLSERKKQREKAVLTFTEYSNFLYEKPGILSINTERTGYQFNIKIERSSSTGFENMKIFCYDLMLTKLWAKKTKSPAFLIHDSTIFDGVDARQIAAALKLARAESEKGGFQYICTMNLDSVPFDDFDSDFDFNNFVRMRLTDATKDGGLLGFRI